MKHETHFRRHGRHRQTAWCESRRAVARLTCAASLALAAACEDQSYVSSPPIGKPELFMRMRPGDDGGGGSGGLNEQTITFTSTPPNPAYVGGAYTVGATATSALTVSFSSMATGVCTVTGNAVSLVAAGTCIVAADQSGNGTYAAADQTTQSFTVSMQSTDATPPVIAFNVAGTLGQNGWYTSDVTVTWSVTENESPSTLAKTGCVDQNITSDQSATSYYCSASSTGGLTGPVSVPINRDATPPSIGISIPSPNANGWYSAPVTADFICSDAGSGLAANGCPSDVTWSTEGMHLSAWGLAIDQAGNSASATVGGIHIDRTLPVVTVTGVTNGATYPIGSVPAAGCNTSDALSGVATNATFDVTGAFGSVTATCSGAADNAGNTNSASVTYTVAWPFTGFFGPVNNQPTLNVAKAGSAIPIKFSLGGDRGLGIFASGSPSSRAIACPSAAAPDQIEQTVAASTSGLAYDASTDQYSYVWKTTKSLAGTCRELLLTLVDGTTRKASFRFK
jgi:hypothetical protein